MKQDISTLSELCNVPTAPYAEAYAAACVRSWAAEPQRRNKILVQSDAVGNLHLLYQCGSPGRSELVLEAHLDHPGFLVEKILPDGTLEAIFRGGVKPSSFDRAAVRIWHPECPLALPHDTAQKPVGLWIPTRVLSVQPAIGNQPLRVILAKPDGPAADSILPGSIGMWALPDALTIGRLFAARVCDDLAGVAVGLYVLDELIARGAAVNVRLLLTRAEEVGFAGALAVASRGLIPASSCIIGIETSMAMAHVPQGRGPVIRVGDKSLTFSPALTRFLSMQAGGIADTDNSYLYQRQLMDGGTCDSSAFAAFGYDTAAVCLALGNYHNMAQLQMNAAIPTAGPHIAAETIHLDDFFGLVRLLTDAAANFDSYTPDHAALRQRLASMHERDQRQLLESFKVV